jgi:D-alanine-D-alanine ligase-like ATP-grasp enzyme
MLTIRHISRLILLKSASPPYRRSSGAVIDAGNAQALAQIDVVFPIVHGTLGEDGSLQGMLRMANLPFVGSDVLGSAACMDKDVTKRLLRDAGLNIAPFVTSPAPTATNTASPDQRPAGPAAVC